MIRPAWIASLVLLGIQLVCAEQVTFYVQDPVGRNVVRFESKAPLETIVGTTGQIKGTIRVDLDDILVSPKVEFQVNPASLKTGIELRNRRMRAQYLETDLYPTIQFELKRIPQVSQKKLESEQSVDIRAIGTISLHGMIQDVQVRARAIYLPETAETRRRLPGNLLQIEAQFSIRLGDFNIPVPQLVALKLDETIDVFVDVFATDAPKASKVQD